MSEEKKKKIDIAEDLLRQKKYKKAITVLKDLHRNYPEEESILLMLSLALYDSGDTKQCKKYLSVLFERELHRKVFTGFAFDELVRIYKQEKDFVKLVDICEKASLAQPDDVSLLTELGHAYLQSGKTSKACDVCEKLISMEGDNPAFYCLWGEALFAAGLLKESEKVFMKAAEIDSEQSDNYYFKIAVLFQNARNYQEAEKLFHKCISMDSLNPLYYCSLGDCFVSMGETRKALDTYEKAIQCDGSRAAAYYNRLGNAFMKTGNFSQAAEAFQSAIKHEPVQHYYSNLASAYRGMGLSRQADMIMTEINKKN